MGIFTKYDLLSTELGDSGEIRVKIGDSARDIGAYDGASWWGTPGFIARPKSPDSDGACQAIVNIEGSNVRIVGQRDNRLTSKYGQLAEGDSAIVGYGNAALIVKDASDSVSLVTANHASNDETMIVQLNGQKGELTVMIGGGSGTSMLKIKSGRIVLAVDNGGSITIDSQGVHITGNTFDCATGGGNLGVLGPIAPPAGVFSILAGPSGDAAQPSTKWVVST